jgi:hypothetical protein
MKSYECVIAPVKEPDNESTVIVEAKDKGEALVVNCELRPGTYVKSITEIV